MWGKPVNPDCVDIKYGIQLSDGCCGNLNGIADCDSVPLVLLLNDCELPIQQLGKSRVIMVNCLMIEWCWVVATGSATGYLLT